MATDGVLCCSIHVAIEAVDVDIVDDVVVHVEAVDVVRVALDVDVVDVVDDVDSADVDDVDVDIDIGVVLVCSVPHTRLIIIRSPVN